MLKTIPATNNGPGVWSCCIIPEGAHDLTLGRPDRRCFEGSHQSLLEVQASKNPQKHGGKSMKIPPFHTISSTICWTSTINSQGCTDVPSSYQIWHLAVSNVFKFLGRYKWWVFALLCLFSGAVDQESFWPFLKVYTSNTSLKAGRYKKYLSKYIQARKRAR